MVKEESTQVKEEEDREGLCSASGRAEVGGGGGVLQGIREQAVGGNKVDGDRDGNGGSGAKVGGYKRFYGENR